ncbi:MAG TPA: MFS transporter [Bacteroidales bacterium]|nr:MFS transporter [Bacteroidales bacterium]
MYSRKRVFTAACLGMLLFGICLITLGSIIPDLKEKISLDDLSSGALFSILPFGILTGSLIFGPFCDKFGYKLMLVLSASLMFAGFVALANVTSLGFLKVSIFFFGLAGGAINGATNALVSDLSDRDKGANLSLLGVFFGIGALGMPFILGLLKDVYSFEVIVTAVGFLTLAAGLFFLLIKFPPPKHSEGVPLKESLTLLKDSMLLLIAFFLFFQSSFEGVIQNWTTSYLIEELSIQHDKALFALTVFVSGMVVMRLLIGSLLRSTAPGKILVTSFGIILAALVLMKTGNTFIAAALGLFLLGTGLAGGFPIMLGFVGDRFIKLSGTAFSIAFVIALTGNMLINYLMGIIAQRYGIHHLMNLTFVMLAAMITLGAIILKKRKTNSTI